MIALKNVLVAVDFGDASAAALDFARDLAHASRAALRVVHVVDDVETHLADVPVTVVDRAELQRTLRQEAAARLAALAGADPLTTTAVLVSTDPAAAILADAAAHDIDLIVLGTHGRGGFADLFMGSVAQQVLRKASCPVLTMRG